MKNDYNILGKITAIIINSPKYGRKEALISTSKLGRAREFQNSWGVRFCKSSNTFYVEGRTSRVNGKQKAVMLHRWLTNAPVGMVVDHRNHDGLINTDDNLRICTHAENKQNLRGAQSNSKSGIRGVHWSRINRKWKAQITINGEKTYLGYFTEIEEAEKAATEARLKMMPYAVESA